MTQMKTRLSTNLPPFKPISPRGQEPFTLSVVRHLKNIDVAGINLNTEAILVSGLLIVKLWRTDFILIWKEFVIL